MTIFIVYGIREQQDADDEVRIIGVYSSSERAWSAIDDLPSQQEFLGKGWSFEVDQCELDKDYWTEGFITD